MVERVCKKWMNCYKSVRIGNLSRSSERGKNVPSRMKMSELQIYKETSTPSGTLKSLSQAVLAHDNLIYLVGHWYSIYIRNNISIF